MTTLYKVTGPNMEAVHGGTFTYALGEWTPRIEHVSLCNQGYHITPAPMDWARVGMRVFEVETKGLSPDYNDNPPKRVAKSILLTCERPDMIPDWWRHVEDFISTIGTTPWFDIQGPPDPEWNVFETWNDAYDAAQDAAHYAAYDAARGAARGAALRAARDAAWDAAEDAVWNAVWNDVRDAAWDVARGAALMAQMTIVSDLAIDPKHRIHAEQRWDVWRRGYGLYGDVDGVLYVYRKAG